ncbi:MAG TPA: hypothetical protein VJ696_02190 [Rhodanobacteraceae bacterium]|nr:hypothetical protein [Rhodanobacteraceae bacterium]
MVGEAIPDDLRRFLLASSLSVPHVEAILLMRRDPARAWDGARLAARLYIAERTVGDVLAELARMRLVAAAGETGKEYRYAPATPELAVLIDRLDETYSKHLVEVTRLIHSVRDQTAERFAAAFRFREES